MREEIIKFSKEKLFSTLTYDIKDKAKYYLKLIDDGKVVVTDDAYSNLKVIAMLTTN